MRFLVDAQLPPMLAENLRIAGFDAIHVADLDLLAATDSRIWDKAAEMSAVLVSNDRDFALLRAARRHGPQILWIRFGNADNRVLMDSILRAMPKIVEALKRGEVIVELVR